MLCVVRSGCRADNSSKEVLQRVVSEYDREVSVKRRLWPTGGAGDSGGVAPWEKNIMPNN